MAGLSVPRREVRSARVTVAVVLLGCASALVVGAIALREPFVVAAAGVAAVTAGWVALRLAWSAVVDGRLEHAVDRTELARAYRNLFAERAVEQAGFVDSMATRLAQRDRTISTLRADLTGLRGEVEQVRIRAVELESSAAAARTRLAGAHDQIAAMETLITEHLRQRDLLAPGASASSATTGPPPPAPGTALTGTPPPTQPARESARESALDRAGDLPGPRSQRPPLLRRRGSRSEERATGPVTVPEWARLEPDPVESLLAWEQRADRLRGEAESGRRGRHSAG